MRAEDVTDTLDLALSASGCGSARLLHKPSLLSDNGPSSISGELAQYIGAQIEAFVEHYNHQRYHESLSNVTPADAYSGKAPAIIKQRERIKRQTIEHRRLQHRMLAA
jgi:transposase InsO family protein